MDQFKFFDINKSEKKKLTKILNTFGSFSLNLLLRKNSLSSFRKKHAKWFINIDECNSKGFFS